MKNLLLCLGFGLLAAGSASASVVYTTSGSFSCTDATNGGVQLTGCGSTAITLDDAAAGEIITLTFDGLPTTSVNATSGTFSSYGDIVVTCAGTGCVANA